MSFFGQPHYRYGSLHFVQCASGCEAARSPVNYCRCACRGINHGRLLYGRELRPVPYQEGTYAIHEPSYLEPQAQAYALPPYSVPALPSTIETPFIENRTAVPAGSQPHVTERRPNPVTRASGKAAKKIGKSFLKALALGESSETELNEAIYSGLRKQYSEERVEAIIDSAFTEYYSHPGNQASNRPELYELEESGVLDQGMERLGLRWVIGRPKRKRN